MSDVVLWGRCSVTVQYTFHHDHHKEYVSLTVLCSIPLSLDLELAIVVGILELVENPPDLSAVRLVELVD